MVFFKLNTMLKLIPLIFCRKTSVGEVVGICHYNDLVRTLFFLKKSIGYQYDLLTSISGVDFVGKNYRFSVVYELLSLTYNARFRLKVFLNEGIALRSSESLYKNANWYEREVWDCYGIFFNEHSDLRRILTDYGFEGHPLRKDFPLVGFFEYRYSEKKCCVVPHRLSLSQDLRRFRASGILSVNTLQG